MLSPHPRFIRRGASEDEASDRSYQRNSCRSLNAIHTCSLLREVSHRDALAALMGGRRLEGTHEDVLAEQVAHGAGLSQLLVGRPPAAQKLDSEPSAAAVSPAFAARGVDRSAAGRTEGW